MTADDFVEAIQHIVRDGAVRSAIGNIENPPDRDPDSDLLEVASWYSRLPTDVRSHVASFARLTASHAVLSFLSVIDGARAIESGPDKGHFELYFVKGPHRTLLNDPESEPLNDKLRD